MAYNVLKGNVQFINSTTGSIESMVDDYSDQTIAGIKTFSSAITASGGISSPTYSATNVNSTSGSFAHLTVSSSINQTPLLILEKGETESSFIEFKKEGVKHAEIKANNVETFIIKTEATSYPIWFQQAANYPIKIQNTNVTFEAYPVHVSQSLHVTGSSFVSNLTASSEISASAFFGSGEGLSNISATSLNLGDGVENSSGDLAVKLSASSGLSLASAGLGVSPNNAVSISSLANDDAFLVSDDNDSNKLKKATMTNLSTYMNNTLSFTTLGGSDTQIFFNNGGSAALGADATFTFNDTTKVMSVTGISASSNVSGAAFYGDGGNLTNLPAAELNGNVSAANINIGHGLFNNSTKLAVSASFGLTASANGLEVTASNTSGLDVSALTGLAISPSRTAAKGSPVAADIIILGDSDDGNKPKNATLESVVTLVQNNGAVGSNTQVQFNNSNAFAGSSAFTFNSATNTLAVQEVSSSGNISASFFYGDGSNLQNVGGQSAFNNFTANFTVAQESDILGIVTTGSAITASLSAANTYDAGQRFIFKDVSGSCSGSNHIVISASAYDSGDRIDGQGIAKIQTGFGSITLASDGMGNFYIVGTN